MDDLLSLCTPVNLRASIISQLVTAAGFANDTLYSTSKSVDSYQCYQLTLSPSNIDWINAYNKDASNKVIFPHLSVTSKPSWSPDLLKQIQPEFHQRLKTD